MQSFPKQFLPLPRECHSLLSPCLQPPQYQYREVRLHVLGYANHSDTRKVQTRQTYLPKASVTNKNVSFTVEYVLYAHYVL